VRQHWDISLRQPQAKTIDITIEISLSRLSLKKKHWELEQEDGSGALKDILIAKKLHPKITILEEKETLTRPGPESGLTTKRLRGWGKRNAVLLNRENFTFRRAQTWNGNLLDEEKSDRPWLWWRSNKRSSYRNREKELEDRRRPSR